MSFLVFQCTVFYSVVAINIHFMYACDIFVIFCVYRDIIHIVNMVRTRLVFAETVTNSVRI